MLVAEETGAGSYYNRTTTYYDMSGNIIAIKRNNRITMENNLYKI
jgi:hypothetical protein